MAASASVFSVLSPRTPVVDAQASDPSSTQNSQQMALSSGSNIGPGTLSGTVTGGIDTDTVISGAALTPAMGPVGNASDAADFEDAAGGISFYTVHSGDTVGTVAEMFNVDQNTILSANNLKKGQALTVGDTLVILPVKGLRITVKKGDTVTKLAQTYKADTNDIYFYNNLNPGDGLVVGDTIIIPDGIESATSPKRISTPVKKSSTPIKFKSGAPIPMTADGLFTTNYNGPSTAPITVHPAKLTSKVDLSDEIVLPIDPLVGRLSQGLHATNAIDIAAPLGTPIHAVADGTVLLAHTGGYADGFGNYVILLSVRDGVEFESIYAHQAKVLVTTGQHVSAGDVIGQVGKTGDATGYHLHVEFRGIKNTLVSAYRRQ